MALRADLRTGQIKTGVTVAASRARHQIALASALGQAHHTCRTSAPRLAALLGAAPSAWEIHLSGQQRRLLPCVGGVFHFRPASYGLGIKYGGGRRLNTSAPLTSIAIQPHT